jgi:hypothetical protein
VSYRHWPYEGPQDAADPRDIVGVTHESIGSDPKIINVLLFEHPADNMSISGRIHGEEPK